MTAFTLGFTDFSRLVIGSLLAFTTLSSSSQNTPYPPGKRLLENCELVNQSNLATMQLVARVACITFVHTTLSYYRTESMFAAAENQKALKDKKEGMLRTNPSPFCYSYSREKPIAIHDATAEIPGFVRYLKSQPHSKLQGIQPSDDVELSLLWEYLTQEYPCDDYHRTFGHEARKYRPARPQ